jgi:cellulose biosynthesis protein BcsQ
MPIVALQNFKGGVGKTALTVALAASLARRGRRVLAVDMDPQANLSRRLGFTQDPSTPVPTLSEALKAAIPGCAAEIITRCGWADPAAAQIDLLPSRFDLENRIYEAGTVGAVQRLVVVTRGMLDPYDWVLIDCPPSLGHLTQMSMVLSGQPHRGSQAGWVLIVTEPEFDSMDGAVHTAEFVTEHASTLGVPRVRVAGVIVNRTRPTDLHRTNIADIESMFGDLVWSPYVPLWVTLADAQNSAVPVHSLPGERAATLAAHVDTLTDRLEHLS